MHRSLAIALLLIAAFACTKTDEFTIPLSEFAQSFIPVNKDSIEFSKKFLQNSEYLRYSNYYSTFSSGSVSKQIIEQFAANDDSSFFLSYTLQAGFPIDKSDGGPSKTDQLNLVSTTTSKTLFISENTLSGDLLFKDSLVLNTKMYYNVFSDDASYYFTLEDGIIGYFNGSSWLYKKN